MEPVARVGNAVVGSARAERCSSDIWLAFSYGDYDLWDGWIIAAIVLWVAAAAVGSRTGAEYMKPLNKARELSSAGQAGPNDELIALNRTSARVVLHAIATVLAVLLLIDMIWKPGA